MKTFWIANITNRQISLGDIGILLQPYQSVNLLDKKRYPLISEKDIEFSFKSGSLYKRSNSIIKRNIPPEEKILKTAAKIEVDTKGEYPSKIRSILEHKEFNYDEMQISDDEYAKENADLAEEDDLGRYKK